MRNITRTLATTIAAMAVGLSFCGLVAAGSGLLIVPTVTADHAFAGDPLFGLNTQAGTIFGIQPNEKTAMASTTKVWTFDLTAHALAQGWVGLDDKVTITKAEANVGGSSMKDVNGTPLEAGEVVKLRDLIRGMMYPSGNNATYAIARHVAQAYYGPNADWHDFVTMMNTHAAAEGLTKTHFENPNGFDGPTHYTTASELAQQFNHGLQDPFFAQVESFKGTYTATTQGPKGPKMYSFKWGGNYPGWEGEKNGITPNCDGAASGCIVRAATRIGRRVVVATMQGTRGAEEDAMLDYGFASIFYPDPHGGSDSWGETSRHDLDCFGSRAVSVVLSGSGQVKLVLGHANLEGSSITKNDEAIVPVIWGRGGVGPSDVAVTNLPSGDIIVAVKKGVALELSRWTIARNGTLLLLASSIQAGTATTMGLQPVYDDMFVTAATTPDGKQVLKSWRLQGTGLVNLDTFSFSWNFSEVAIARPLTADLNNGHRAVTAAIGGPTGGKLVQDTWGVDEATGAISPLGELLTPYPASHVAISPLAVKPVFDGEFLPAYYATGYLDQFGDLAVKLYRIDAGGAAVEEGAALAYGGALFGNPPGDEVRLSPLGTEGVMTAARGATGNVQLGVMEARRNPDNTITPGWVSTRQADSAASIDLCRIATAHSEGDYLTATKDPDGQLRLRAYRSGDRPY